jgi:hypothetical protein
MQLDHPGPNSGKLATCLSQLYHEYKRGVTAGYAKFETFPIWNLPLAHPVNVAYEAATPAVPDHQEGHPRHPGGEPGPGGDPDRPVELGGRETHITHIPTPDGTPPRPACASSAST